MNYMSRVIHNLSLETAILQKLTPKSVKWKWGSAEKNAINYLKNLAMKNKTLTHL